MLVADPRLLAFILALSSGMSLVLLLMLKVPGDSGRCKLYLGLYLLTYLLPLGFDIPYFLGASPSRASAQLFHLIMPACFWSGPTLLWSARSMAGRWDLSPRGLAGYLLGLLCLDILLAALGDAAGATLLAGVTAYSAAALLWVLSHGFLALRIARRRGILRGHFHRGIIWFLMSIAVVRTALSGLEDEALGYLLGVAAVPSMLLAAQLAAVLEQRLRRGAGSSRGAIEGMAERFSLSGREAQVLLAVSTGAGNKEIAAEFSISENTVKRHMGSLFRKCGVSSRFELAALSRGWSAAE